MKRGLVIGKFVPLHRGHQLLIETALSRCDDVTVVVYDTPVIPPFKAPVQKRAKWVRDLYPQLENVCWVPDPLAHLQQEERDHPAHAPTYARQLYFLGGFDEVITSEPSYESFAQHMGARHVVVDAARSLVPISGTAIRANLYENRGFIDPAVYSSLIQKVVFVGTESTGKSTISKALAEKYNTLWVHEFGRELWVAQGGGTFTDHVRMGERQYAREQAALPHCREFLFCDTNAWTTLMWCYMTYGTADPQLEDLVTRTLREYRWFVCEDDFEWVDDGVRELRDGSAHIFQKEQEADLTARLDEHGLGCTYLSGSLEERIKIVEEDLGIGN